MEFRRKITFCCYIYYLTVSQNEYCVPSALWGRCRGADWWGAALRFASCPNLCKGSFPLSWSVWHMDAALSNLSLSGYDFNVASVLWTFTAALHFTLRPALRCHRFWNSDWCSPTFPLSRCHCVKFNASVCHYPLWLEDSATVAAFEENWRFPSRTGSEAADVIERWNSASDLVGDAAMHSFVCDGMFGQGRNVHVQRCRRHADEAVGSYWSYWTLGGRTEKTKHCGFYTEISTRVPCTTNGEFIVKEQHKHGLCSFGLSS